MAIITKPNTFSAGTVAVASQVNADLDTLFNDYNGNITAANLSPTLALSDTQLNQIVTAGKVSGAALVSLGSIPSTGGKVPTANLGSGTADNSVFLRGDQTWSAATLTASNALSGSIIQTIYSESSTQVAVTALFNNDDTPPLYNEGNAIISNSITPNNASNKIRITFLASGVASGSLNSIIYLTDATGSDQALQVISQVTSAANAKITLSLTRTLTAGTTSAITFYIVGAVDGNTLNVASSSFWGDTSFITLILEEIKA